ncbi:hypothetical protein BU26DRAFT_350389 [Trematosphaeria pertusa]|uniref:Uncharacterized protein n=1 Tax=Trematosphaeria pertusa TaxID=390896 RepID=A0A6A6IB38_9PLEO|nr:uncharacterized protein BU26DRAFT_350389 [Trematosphaeria pertusa]KAF2247601.1 hypothetical protein BU26DRAFT_350389 [Trematosphaeria pertusa]
MPGPRRDAYALLESSFQASPNLRSHKALPRRRDDSGSFHPAAEPLKDAISYPDDETEPQISTHHRSPLASSGAPTGADTGLPPTPPSNSQDGIHPTEYNPPPHADGLVASLASKKSTVRTPVNQRSPPTPDPSPPRTTESMSTPERPPLFAYPSSRAESFTTAREDLSTEGDSRSATPLGHRLSTVEEDRGLGLAFERDDNDPTPTNRIETTYPENHATTSEQAGDKDALDVEDIPNREWDTNLMRNVTVRRKRSPKPSPQKNLDSIDTSSQATRSTRRRSNSLRERIDASKNSPQTPSMEDFAKSIGWPTEPKDIPDGKPNDANDRRLSGSSMSSTVVEAMVIVTPPQKRRTLRHSGKNLAFRRDTDSPTEFGSVTYSNRNSMHSDDVPLHKLVHKRASISERKKRASTDSDTLGDRTASPLSVRKRSQDSAAFTLAHQESVRRVLQPAAEIMSRSNSVARPTAPERSYHKRISSAPEPTRRREASPTPQTFLEASPPDSPSPRRPRNAPTKLRYVERTSSPTPADAPQEASQSSPKSPKVLSPIRRFTEPMSPINLNKSLPELPMELPIQTTNELAPQEDGKDQVIGTDPEHRPPSPLLERVRNLLAEREAAEAPQQAGAEPRQPTESSRPRASSAESVPTIRRGSVSTRGRSEERRRSSHSQDRSSTSPQTLPRFSLDRAPTEEIPRTSHEWHSFHTDEHGRLSFDRSTSRAEEHAMARHLFAQTTPFSQFSQLSDTPIEVSEATAVSIYPHNNHSLLVVQQVARPPQAPEQRQVANEPHFTSSHFQESDALPTPPFVDAREDPHDQLPKPTLTFEPSTPPMQIALPNPNVVDSPLKNPRKPPEPPVVQLIPPTPMEELERQLPPGPPKRSDSHPQRRLSLKQRARRYSDNLITPFLARATSIRGRHASNSHAEPKSPRIPTVNDEDGSLHPFWRPRGFWDGFEDSESDEEDDAILPQGGDTSDVAEPEPEPHSPRKLGVLGRRLTNGFKGSGGFLIGNSLGVERSGTNRRRHHVELPVHSRRTSKSTTRTNASAPKVLIQPPTLPIRTRSPRIEQRGSGTSMRSSGSYERGVRKRGRWRDGKRIPGFKGVQVQYIGLSGVKERFREKKAEKRREEIRKSIGSRYYVEPASPGVGGSAT